MGLLVEWGGWSAVWMSLSAANLGGAFLTAAFLRRIFLDSQKSGEVPLLPPRSGEVTSAGEGEEDEEGSAEGEA